MDKAKKNHLIWTNIAVWTCVILMPPFGARHNPQVLWITALLAWASTMTLRSALALVPDEPTPSK